MNAIAAKVNREARRRGAETWNRRPLWFVSKSRPTVDVVVSLTTFPARVNSCAATLRSLVRQTVQPTKIVVVLANDQFDTTAPKVLWPFLWHNVEFIFDRTPDTRSYKKLLPTRRQFPDATIVTADDDAIYPRTWLEQIVAGHRAHPNDIVGLRGTRILGGRNDLRPYVEWPAADTSTPSGRTFLTGIGGVAYPPTALPDMAFDAELATRLCPTADDIWFKAMALHHRTTVRRLIDHPFEPLVVRSAQKHSLRDVNVGDGQNEAQFRAVMDHFDLWDRLGT